MVPCNSPWVSLRVACEAAHSSSVSVPHTSRPVAGTAWASSTPPEGERGEMIMSRTCSTSARAVEIGIVGYRVLMEFKVLRDSSTGRSGDGTDKPLLSRIGQLQLPRAITLEFAKERERERERERDGRGETAATRCADARTARRDRAREGKGRRWVEGIVRGR